MEICYQGKGGGTAAAPHPSRRLKPFALKAKALFLNSAVVGSSSHVLLVGCSVLLSRGTPAVSDFTPWETSLVGRPEAAWEARWDPLSLALSPAQRTGCLPGHGRYGRADISRVNPGGGSQSPAECPAPGHRRHRLDQPQPCAGTHRPLRASASLMLFHLPLTT